MTTDNEDIVVDGEGEETSPEVVLITDDFTLATINTETGEILGIEDAPDEDLDIIDIIDWVGMRRMKANAKLQGLRTEKAEWSAKLDKQFDPQIRHLERFVKYLDEFYTPMMRDYAKKALDGKKTKTLKVSFLELSFGTTRARVDIVDNDKAVAFCKKNKLAEAIKTTTSVLKSAIPAALRAKLTVDKQDKTGLFFYPGGEETFTIK
jgi:phage host-nuclease inhibitor protein Gam